MVPQSMYNTKEATGLEIWKRNLYFLWAGTFLSSVGISMIIPFLPYYVHDLGIHDVKYAALWAAYIFAGNHFFIALSSPLWGRLSDKYGQKMMMLRSGIGMGIIIMMMGFVHTLLELLLLRMTMGLVAGFITAATSFQAIETSKEHVGKALGVLQTGNVSGNLLGPMFGGLRADTLGIREAFYLTGGLMLLRQKLVILNNSRN
jgi:MFS family permease